MNDDYYLLLAGGIGAAKFIEGLANVVDQELLKIIVNTGDDIELFGLNISPDLDIITYTLANMVDKEKGWGLKPYGSGFTRIIPGCEGEVEKIICKSEREVFEAVGLEYKEPWER